jgi:hypothetical protein
MLDSWLTEVPWRDRYRPLRVRGREIARPLNAPLPGVMKGMAHSGPDPGRDERCGLIRRCGLVRYRLMDGESHPQLDEVR